MDHELIYCGFAGTLDCEPHEGGHLLLVTSQCPEQISRPSKNTCWIQYSHFQCVWAFFFFLRCSLKFTHYSLSSSLKDTLLSVNTHSTAISTLKCQWLQFTYIFMASQSAFTHIIPLICLGFGGLNVVPVSHQSLFLKPFHNSSLPRSSGLLAAPQAINCSP